MAAAGHARDPRRRPARRAARHHPAVPELLGDPRRRREGAAARTIELHDLKGPPPCAPTSRPAARSRTTRCPTTPTSPGRSSELQGDDPMILTLARGSLLPEGAPAAPRAGRRLPADRRGLHAGRHDLDRRPSRAAGVPGLGRRASGRSCPIPDASIQQDLDIQEYTDPEHDPMIPHTLVLKPGLVVHSIYNGYWFWGRPSVEDLRQDLRAVIREVRLDWDLATPGLRARWDGRRPGRRSTAGPRPAREPPADRRLRPARRTAGARALVSVAARSTGCASRASTAHRVFGRILDDAAGHWSIRPADGTPYATTPALPRSTPWCWRRRSRRPAAR